MNSKFEDTNWLIKEQKWQENQENPYRYFSKDRPDQTGDFW